MDTVIILSGGMDSAVVMADAIDTGHTVAAISFNYGAKHNAKELHMASRLCQRYGVVHHIVDLPFINQLFSSNLLASGGDIPDGAYDSESMKQTVVPFRNGIMLSIAAGYAESVGAKHLLIGSHSGDHTIYPDCRPEFNAAMGDAIYTGTDRQVVLKAPFASKDKRDIGNRGRELGVDFTCTWTCYKGGEIHCGTCGACDERKYALGFNEGTDPTTYQR